jgi:chromatin segregation and condensation protein Rec8/ScpA/Scc1 (kleisin family)
VLVSGALVVNIEDSDLPGDKLLQLLRDNQIDLNAVEGLRLVVAFRKIKDPSDRRTLIELAERLAK